MQQRKRRFTTESSNVASALSHLPSRSDRLLGRFYEGTSIPRKNIGSTKNTLGLRYWEIDVGSGHSTLEVKARNKIYEFRDCEFCSVYAVIKT
jgi:hypothetical protein